jgi:hypothetical protein
MNKIKIIENIIKGSPNRLRDSYFIKNNKDIYDEIIDYTSDISDIRFPFKIWHWVNNRPDYVSCYCGGRVSPKMNWRDGYKEFCSNKCSSNNESTRYKLKQTLNDRYGVDHYSKTKDYAQKVKKTSLDKWGVDNFSKTEEYLIKSKRTYLSKWGVDNFTKTEEYLEKSKRTFLERWGVEYPTQSEEIRNKIKNTNKKKYGTSHIFMSDKYRIDNFKISKDNNYISYENGVNLFKCDCDGNHTFEISTDDYYGRTKSGNKLCTICYPISDLSSIKEKMLLDYIRSIYSDEIIINWRDKYEIDIYLPDLKLGFEFNGLYWHSDKFKDNNYHLNKTNWFKEIGIRIIHIWEDDWIYKNEIIKSQIKNWLGLTENKVYARNCQVKEIKDSKQFLNNNHIQGSDRSNVKLGLFYDGDLLSVMTFNKTEGRKKMKDDEWNLSRFCNKLDFNIVGGASKMIKYFINKYKPKRIISYSDKDWSSGNVYYKLGFNLVDMGRSDYKYVINSKRVNKSRFRKSNLKTKMSESQYMNEMNINKVWDCGKIKFEKTF